MNILQNPARLQEYSSLPAVLYAQAQRMGDQTAQWRHAGNGYTPLSYRWLAEKSRALANGLMALGVQEGDRVAILMENRPEWAVVDYGILSCGAVTVPLYCSYRAQDLAYVLNDSSSRIAICSGGKLLRHLLEAKKHCPRLDRVFALDAPVIDGVQPFEALLSSHADRVDDRLATIDRSRLATLIYTSGTTGEPKGVMLTHGNLLANIESILRVVPILPNDKMLSFLPLAHSFERMAGHFLAYTAGISVAFAERPDTLMKNLLEAQPTILLSVPRLYEVVYQRILQRLKQSPAWKRHLAFLYLEGRGGWLQPLLDRMVGRQMRSLFGDNMRMLISGGAPLPVHVGKFFQRIGLPIIEGYGMTEASPVISVNPVDAPRLGTVGKPLPGVSVRIGQDGEILVQGANVMKGYWGKPEETAEALADGWLHTGDVGEMDKDGYLKITDRKKDIIVNSGGENIAPQRIEALIASDGLIEQAVVFGDKKPYLIAIVIPNREACEAWAQEKGLPATTWEGLSQSAILRKELQTRINRVLAHLPPQEQVRRILVDHKPFTLEEGLLTPTMKIKRRLVYQKYLDQIEALYAGS